MSDVRNRAQAYLQCVAESLNQFPAGPAVNLVNWGPARKLGVHLLLPTGERPDAYAEGFAKRLASMGVTGYRIEHAGAADGVGPVVDIGDRIGRRPNRFPGVLELQQAVTWYGMEHFAHLRAESIRKTVKYFNQLMGVADMLYDPVSRETLYALVVDQLTGVPLELQRLALSYDTQYFGTGLFDLAANEVVVDAGAAHGDSIQKFQEKRPDFERWFAFDPDPVLHPMLKDYIRQHSLERQVVAEQVPLTERTGDVYMRIRPGTGNTCLTSGSEEDVMCFRAKSIDDYLSGQRVSIIKMDVEGAELSLLRGAERSIRNYRPKLLISVYHEIEDLFQVPEYIKSLGLDYRMHLRNHTWAAPDESWPGAYFCETVLYAV